MLDNGGMKKKAHKNTKKTVRPQDGMPVGKCQFSNKKQYVSEDAALKAMAHNVQSRSARSIMRGWVHAGAPFYHPIVKNECRAYKCPVCKLWHLTSVADPEHVRLTTRELMELHPEAMAVADKWLRTNTCGTSAYGDLRTNVVRSLADSKVADELWVEEWLWAIARSLYSRKLRLGQWHEWARMIAEGYAKTDDVMKPDASSKADFALISHITTDTDEMTELFNTPAHIAIIAAWQAYLHDELSRLNREAEPEA